MHAQARSELNFTVELQGPTVDQLASQPQGSDVLKRALSDLLPGVCEHLHLTSSHLFFSASLEWHTCAALSVEGKNTTDSFGGLSPLPFTRL